MGVSGSDGKIIELDLVTGHDVISPRMISTQTGVLGKLFLFSDLKVQWLVFEANISLLGLSEVKVRFNCNSLRLFSVDKERERILNCAHNDDFLSLFNLKLFNFWSS